VSSFIGRRAEVEVTTAALRRCRIVTLCGPGGVGKTRLARHTAAAVADDYLDGVHVIDLEAATTRTDLVAMIAAALRLTPTGDESLEDRIVSVLSIRRQLLVLDTCEHVVEAAAGVAEAIATGTDGVDILATSREPLRADGEQLLRIGPLRLEEATALLADRIRAADPSAEPMDTDPALLSEVARRLDGLPLACELAAARVPSLGLPGVLQALDAPLTLLTHGKRTATSRHRSLRDVVRWSIDLLSEPERDVFARLSRFAASVEYAAVAAVGPSAELLADLVDHSLVVRVPGELPRYGLLETLRAYGRSDLSPGMDLDEFNRRHAAWAGGLVADVAAARLGPGEPAARRRFDAHLPDLRQAHGWLLATGHVDELLAMDVVFAELAYERGLVELTQMVEDCLRHLCGEGEDQGPTHPLLARVFGLAGQWSWQRGDHVTCERRCRRAVEIAERAGCPEAARDAYECWGNLHQLQGQWEAARRHLLTAVELGRRANDSLTVGLALSDLVLVETYAGDDRAAAHYERVVSDLAHETQSPSILAYAAYAAGERRAERDPATAAPYLDEAIRHGEAADTLTAAYARHTLLTTGARAAEPEMALPQFGALIDYWLGLGAWGTLWLAIRALAETLSRCGRHGDAVRLLAAHDASPRAAPLIAADAVRRDTVLARARDALGGDFPAVLAEGRTLGDARAVALARRLAR
jgi:predicted ATPase